MRRGLNLRFDKLADRIREIRRARVMGPDQLRLAWAAYQERGVVPRDPDQAAYVRRLEAFCEGVDKLHRVVRPAE